MAIKPFDRKQQRSKRHRRIRKHMAGTAERPRLSVYRSLNHIYAQLIDDVQRVTLAQASSLKAAVTPAEGETQGVAQARQVGRAIAEAAKAKGIDNVIFDRGGFLYHGRVKALADAARETGLKF
ncbi:MAG: 50S ribosomal protein L18 [Candidatus Krumholzibacteriota bacterium]|jgi:large subunit ribosomal protein L18|nr:50S ribosomal protein L18 [Candidatus Krumholzibacteriota bacterium]